MRTIKICKTVYLGHILMQGRVDERKRIRRKKKTSSLTNMAVDELLIVAKYREAFREEIANLS